MVVVGRGSSEDDELPEGDPDSEDGGDEGEGDDDTGFDYVDTEEDVETEEGVCSWQELTVSKLSFGEGLEGLRENIGFGGSLRGGGGAYESKEVHLYPYLSEETAKILMSQIKISFTDKVYKEDFDVERPLYMYAQDQVNLDEEGVSAEDLRWETFGENYWADLLQKNYLMADTNVWAGQLGDEALDWLNSYKYRDGMVLSHFTIIDTVLNIESLTWEVCVDVNGVQVDRSRPDGDVSNQYTLSINEYGTGDALGYSFAYGDGNTIALGGGEAIEVTLPEGTFLEQVLVNGADYTLNGNTIEISGATGDVSVSIYTSKNLIDDPKLTSNEELFYKKNFEGNFDTETDFELGFKFRSEYAKEEKNMLFFPLDGNELSYTMSYDLFFSDIKGEVNVEASIWVLNREEYEHHEGQRFANMWSTSIEKHTLNTTSTVELGEYSIEETFTLTSEILSNLSSEINDKYYDADVPYDTEVTQDVFLVFGLQFFAPEGHVEGKLENLKLLPNQSQNY